MTSISDPAGRWWSPMEIQTAGASDRGFAGTMPQLAQFDVPFTAEMTSNFFDI